MEYIELGRTSLTVSRIALGTVELGMDYGFRSSPHYRKPEEADAIRTIHKAIDLGINLIDTARGYGSSEEIIGRALKESGSSRAPILASKVVVPEISSPNGHHHALHAAITQSIDESLRALRVDTLDLLQIHNTSLEILNNEEAIRALDDAIQAGKARFLGASCTGEPVSMAALADKRISTLQVPLNLLDRGMLPNVLPQAALQGTGIFVRSAFLRGVLTENIDGVPDELSDLRAAALRVRDSFRSQVSSLSELAIRFCLSFDAVSSIVVGIRAISELEKNVSHAARGPLSAAQMEQLDGLSFRNPDLLNPQNWQSVI